MGKTTAGPGSRIEALLDEYGVGANSWVSDLFASDTDRLLLALLLEQRNQDLVEALDDASTEYTSDESTATYYSTEGALPVDDVESETIEFGFQAGAVTAYGFDAPVRLSFVEPGSDNAEIVLDPKQSPFKVAPPDGLDASTLWYSKPDSSSADTNLKVLAFE